MTTEQDITTTPHIGIIGVGRVGTALAVNLAACGYRIAGVYSRTSDHAVSLAERVQSEALTEPEAVIKLSDLTFMTISDDAIAFTSNTIAEKLSSQAERSKAVVHTSGIHSSDALNRLSARGLMTGSLHPALPVTNHQHSDQNSQFEGSGFAVEADHPLLLKWLEQIVDILGGYAFRLEPERKALYHTALVMASNYTVSLYAFAEQLLKSMGLSNTEADGILNPLLQATVDNLRTQGVPDALTGPLVRGDTGTLQQHLEALQQFAPDGLKVYRALARLTYPLISAKGVSVESIEQLLQQDEASWLE
jgi:predicted short-subunit dehydrogenase-like oxidoreductase (DUF2520 family)